MCMDYDGRVEFRFLCVLFMRSLNTTLKNSTTVSPAEAESLCAQCPEVKTPHPVDPIGEYNFKRWSCWCWVLHFIRSGRKKKEKKNRVISSNPEWVEEKKLNLNVFFFSRNEL